MITVLVIVACTVLNAKPYECRKLFETEIPSVKQKSGKVVNGDALCHGIAKNIGQTSPANNGVGPSKDELVIAFCQERKR